MSGNNNLLLTLCFEENSILVHMSIMQTLGLPKQIQMLLNEEERVFVLRACEIDDVSAIVVPKMKLQQYEFPAKSLMKRLRKITGWEDDTPRAMLGDYVRQYNAMLFSLDTAQPVQLRMIPIGR